MSEEKQWTISSITRDLSSQEPTLKLFSKKDVRSKAWKHFKIPGTSIDNQLKFKTCTICFHTLKISTSTGIMSSHFNAKHGKPVVDEKQDVMDNHLFPAPSQKSKKLSPQMKEKLKNGLAMVVIKDLRPFMFMEGEGFLELGQVLIDIGARYGKQNIRQILPHRTTIARHVDVIATKDKKELKAMLAPILKLPLPPISFTFDLWTDNLKMRGFLGITVHWVDDAWVMRSASLGCIEFDAIFVGLNDEDEKEEKSGEEIDGIEKPKQEILITPHTGE